MLNEAHRQLDVGAQSSMRTFCTYFDSRYLTRGLALYESLARHCPGMTLWVLCLDKETEFVLRTLSLNGIRLIALEELEGADPDLYNVKGSRTILEYYFTLTPCLVLHVMRLDSTVDLITYVDADMYLFQNPEPIFTELGTGSVAIIEHRFPPRFAERERFGRFNVGWLIFRNDEDGRECLSWWRERCLEWCFYRLEDGRFADQKYLDEFPHRFENVVVLQHKGANLAPWNIGGVRIHEADGRIMVDDDLLLFFHFHGLRRLTDHLWQLQLLRYRVWPGGAVVRRIYRHYIDTLTGWEKTHRNHGKLDPQQASLGSEPVNWWLVIPIGLAVGDVVYRNPNSRPRNGKTLVEGPHSK